MKRNLFVLIYFAVGIFLCAGAGDTKGGDVPQWAKEAVWYQIFPERFWNGDRANDPEPKDMIGSWPFFIPEDWQISPWTSDWYKLQPWEKNIDWHTHFEWAKPGEANFNAAAGFRRYGGDLRGVLDRLDYLQDLGITAIYFNPLFESPSLHKYDPTMYHHIDNNFGPNPSRDRRIWETENPADPATWQWSTADSLFLKLIRECHQRGIRIIVDGVFNHTGNTFWAFQDVVKNQENSVFKDWYAVKQWDNPKTLEDEFDYEGWFGVKTLPEIAEGKRGLADGFREHLHAVVKRWMDPNGDGDPSDGIDGWRLDAAEKVDMVFWREFRGWVKGINPDAYICGEIWWEDWGKNKIFNAAPWFEGAFDAVMNYRFARAVKQFVIDQQSQISGPAFVDSLRAIYRDYRWENVLACQNLMDSHDVDRLASQIINPDHWYDHDANPSQNPDYDVRKPSPEEFQKLKLIVALQMTLPGAPMIYYGDEAGMWGGDDPDCRKPMVWPELQYDPEVSHPLGKERPKDAVTFDRELFEWYRKLVSIRKENRALSTGDTNFFFVDDSNKVLGFARELPEEKVYIIVNNQKVRKSARIELQDYPSQNRFLRDLIDNAEFAVQNNQLEVPLGPYEVKILTSMDKQ